MRFGKLFAVKDAGPQNSERWKGAQSDRKWRHRSGGLQYGMVVGAVAGVAGLNALMEPFTGSRAPGLIFLFVVALLALFVGRGPVFLAGTLSALVWNFFFLPPHFTFAINSVEDTILFGLYFVISVVLGQLVARIRAQEEAEHERALLAESERLSDALLDSISHELRTPLAVITSAASALAEAPDDRAELRHRLIAEVQEGTARLNRLVGNLLAVNRIESGRVQARLEWCDVKDLIQTTVASLECELSNNPLHFEIAAKMPLARLDFTLMQQALSNLLLNVVSHTPAGTKILIGARHDEKRLLLSVADNGPGLSDDLLPKVFDKFARGSNAQPGGAGLGLAIVKGFVDAQRGRISATNGAGGGVTFTIEMPQSESAPEVELIT